MPWSSLEAVELFHLLFVRALAVGPDKDHYLIKGGDNLRFFFGSVRFSEDLDLDVRITAPGTLRAKIDRLLQSPVLLRPLEAEGIALAGVSAPKQTDTTQRWKLSLARGRLAVSTKVEFSRRSQARGGVLDRVGETITRRYRLAPTLACHYPLPLALAQKVEALAGRPETQARDVFDLAWLLGRAGSDRPRLPAGAVATRALGHLWALDYDDYSAQVVAYLSPEEGEPFASREAWEAMQLRVAEALEGSAHERQ